MPFQGHADIGSLRRLACNGTMRRAGLPIRLAGLPAIWTVCSCVVAHEYTHHAYGDGYWPAVAAEYGVLNGLLVLTMVRAGQRE